MGFEIIVNGRPTLVEGVPPTMTLLEFLRSRGLTGTKLGCAEGDCGACSVALLERDAAGRATYRSINSCIALVPMFAGREIVTVEALAEEAADGSGRILHPVQAAMVEHYGSQCGFCTPGFVVSMFEGYYREDCRDAGAIHGQLCGNLCRCTGYRPIRDAAAAALAARTPQAMEQDRFARRLRQPAAEPAPLDYAAAGERFWRPGSLAELFVLRKAQPEAVLIAGATELGVELNKKFRRLPALISVEAVPELTAIHAAPDAWRIGAAATFTTVEEALRGEYPSLTQMFSVFASRPIRSRATLGGNLVTASPIGDSAPVLITLGASVVLASAAGERTVPLDEFFTGYRKTQLRPDEVMKEIVLPRGDPAKGLTRRADFFKVSHRRELDISIVAGAFCVDAGADGVVRRARIAYGGVAALTVRARRAEQALEGRRLDEAREEVARVLESEFNPIDDVRSAAAYRRGLVRSLWDRFADGIPSEAPGAAPPFAPRPVWTPPEMARALKHESAIGHVTGDARYVDDSARRRQGMLELWPVCSPHARARILSRDVSRARAVPGVATVLLAEDIPGENNVGVARHDETLLAIDEVCYHGHLVAVVVGESVEICRRAAALVEVVYEPLPPIVGIPAAIAKNSYLTEPHVLKRGDCASALALAPHRLAGEFSFGGQEHFYLETQAAWAEIGEAGEVSVCSSTQHPSEIQVMVAEVLGRPLNRVVVESPRMGGGFGGKETQGNTSAALVALAAVKTGRPVRVHWDRDLDMMLTGKRHPFFARYEVGCDSDGKLLAARVELVSDGGWSLDLSQPVLDRALFHLDNGYYIPAVYFAGRVAKTNVTSHTAFRGFGGPQGMLVCEEMMDCIARSLGLPSETVRERNLYHGTGETNTTHYGEPIGDNRLAHMWRMLRGQARFDERRRELAEWNRTHGRIRRGLAITPVKFGIAFTQTSYNKAGAYVLIYVDGTAQVNHGGTEMGQGLHTKVLGAAMRELGLPADAIRVMRTSTDKVPNTSATAASSGADLNAAAVRDACVTLRERLAPVAAKMLAEKGAAVDAAAVVFRDGRIGDPTGRVELPFADVCRRAHSERVNLAATGFYRTPGLTWDWKTTVGRPFHYFACGVAATEVEVDGYTGMSRVLRVDIMHDVGDSLNPGVDRGQIEGGFVQGMGWLTSEELKWNAEGRLLTHSASTYQIPAISDAPVEFNVTLMPAAEQPGTIYGSKAVGEPPLMLAISVREAIRDAVAGFGPAGGRVALASPATGEAIFRAIREREVAAAESAATEPVAAPSEAHRA